MGKKKHKQKDIPLVQQIHEGTVNVEDLSDEEQEQVLCDYNTLALHWVESTKDGYAQLGKEILRLVEQANLEIEDAGNDDWLH
jgi:ABC-type branched-subunit amino acid transport system substrate-binding protein